MASSVMTLAIDPDRKNSRVDCVCDMVKRRRWCRGRLARREHHDKEGVDD